MIWPLGGPIEGGVANVSLSSNEGGIASVPDSPKKKGVGPI